GSFSSSPFSPLPFSANLASLLHFCSIRRWYEHCFDAASLLPSIITVMASPPKRIRSDLSITEATSKSSRLRNKEFLREENRPSSVHLPAELPVPETEFKDDSPSTSSWRRLPFTTTRKVDRLRNTESQSMEERRPIPHPVTPPTTIEEGSTQPSSKCCELAFTQFRDQNILRRLYNLEERGGRLFEVKPQDSEDTRRLKRNLPTFNTWRTRRRSPSPCCDERPDTLNQNVSEEEETGDTAVHDSAPPSKKLKSEIDADVESDDDLPLETQGPCLSWSWMDEAMDEAEEEQNLMKPTRKVGCVLKPFEWKDENCEGILDLPDELIKAVFSSLPRKERAPLSLVCSRFQQLVLECGEHNFEMIDVDWASEVQRVEGMMTGSVSYSFVVDTSNRSMETSRDIRMFKRAHSKQLDIMFNDSAERNNSSASSPIRSPSPSSSSDDSPNSSTECPSSPDRPRINWNRPPNPVAFKLIKDMYFDKVHLVDRGSKRGLASLAPTLFRGITYSHLSADFCSNRDYTALFFQTFIEDRELKESALSLAWSRECNHDTEEALKLIGKIRSVNSLEIKWKLCGDRMPPFKTDEQTILNDYWLNRLVFRSIKANLMTYGDYTAAGILKAFETISESKSSDKCLTLYVKKDVIEELFEMDLSFYEYEKQTKFCFCKYIYDKSRKTELAASFNKIWIKKK
ncbi:hypothetical protein PMAYCL1PPCAC_10697, partial [Pristionchus mayeri]